MNDLGRICPESTEEPDGIILGASQRDIHLLAEPEFIDLERESDSGLMDSLVFVDGGNASFLSYGAAVLEVNRVALIRKSLAATKLPGSGVRDSFEPRSEVSYVDTRKELHHFLSLTYISEDRMLKTNFYSDAADSVLPVDWVKRETQHPFSQAQRLGGRARKIAELLFAREAVRSQPPDALVLDGGLGHGNDISELESLRAVFESCDDNGTSLVGVSKRSAIFSGMLPITFAADRAAAAKGLKHYSALVGTAARAGSGSSSALDTKLYVNKFSSAAKKPYLCEVFGELPPAKLYSSLAVMSRGVYSPGYPSGLIEADRLARIDPQIEVRAMKLRLQKESGDLPLIREALAHDMLDIYSGNDPY